MESALYGIYALVFVSEILLVHCVHSFDFWYINNSCVNTVRQHFPWSILYVLDMRSASSLAYFFLVKRLKYSSIFYSLPKQLKIIPGSSRTTVQKSFNFAAHLMSFYTFHKIVPNLVYIGWGHTRERLLW